MSDQHGFFVFKLRQNINLEGDLILAKMELDVFISGEVKAINDIKDVAEVAPQLLSLDGLTALDSHVRKSGIQAYIADGPLNILQHLVRRISFIQHIYCVAQWTTGAQAILTDITNALGSVITHHVNGDTLVIQAIPHYTLIELSDVVTRQSKNVVETKQNLQEVFDALVKRTVNQRAVKLANTALSAKSITSHLSHGIHYYKAKFFPRLARSILNTCAQRLGTGQHRVIDNFVGSGTTLLEASMLGIPSVGLDIDPLSALIAKTKMEVLDLDSDLLADEVARIINALDRQITGQLGLFDDSQPEISQACITFPTWLMKNRRMTPEVADTLSREIGMVQTAIATYDLQAQDLFRVLISDAISRKIRMRFLGTGVGRFSLTFAKNSIPNIFAKSLRKYVKVVATCEWLKQTIDLRFADTDVVVTDARCIPDSVGNFDILVTSPPYLPAASGRESYAKARAPSLIALGMVTSNGADDLAEGSIGSMNEDGVELESLTNDEYDLVKWLQEDKLRAIKAKSTARYFLDMRRSFIEMHRVLRPGSLAVVVSGKQSTFYEFSSREPLYIVPSAELLATEAYSVGFEVEALLDIKLQKSNQNARPRSLDDYYETLIVLRR